MYLTVAGKRCCVTSSCAAAGPKPASSPPLLLIHGAANDRDAWSTVAIGLAATGYPVLVPDLPGHGLSSGPPLPSIEAIADWLPALLDAAGIDKAVLVGHSMGSLAALECAARTPQRVSCLALLGSSAPMPVADALLAGAATAPDRVYRLITDYSHTPRFQLTGGGHGVWGPGMTLAILRRSPPGVLATDLANCNNYRNGLNAATTVTCPTLLLTGRRDRMTPRRNLSPLQAALRHVIRAEIADCGHAMMNEKPRAVVSELLKFLSVADSIATPPTLAGS